MPWGIASAGPCISSGMRERDPRKGLLSRGARYNELKRGLKTYHGYGDSGGGGGGASSSGALSSLDYLLASGTAGALTAILTNPIWVIKTRMLSSGRSAPGAYHSLGDGVRSILRTDGLLGFYRGLVPALFGVSHGAVQFMAYEQLKNWRSAGPTASLSSAPGVLQQQQQQQPPRTLTNLDFLVLSAIAKVIAGTATYPYQVVRARLQTYDADKTYASTADAVRQIWRREGVKGFYKG